MKKVVIFGAGMVARPIIRYLLEKKYQVTVASNTPDRALELIGSYSNGQVIDFDITSQKEMLESIVSQHDLSVSLLPYIFHTEVAHACLKHKKNMVTTSYVKPEMAALDGACREAGIIILNELGLDPGIDHMSAMRIIDHIHGKGGKVEEFYSICGALPAPEAANNPFRYKFSWSPKGVVMAGNNDAQFLKHGKVIEIPTKDLFKNPFHVDFEGVGLLDVYPNRNSTDYIDIYGIQEAQTVFRGTFRYPGWCETLDAIKALNLISNEVIECSGFTYAQFTAAAAKVCTCGGIKQKCAFKLNIPVDAHAISAIEWLGLFSDEPLNREKASPFDVTSDLMIEKMQLGNDERDMVAMLHQFVASYPDGSKEVIHSRLLDYGTLRTDTSVARTVALPAAIGVEMILNGKINEKGVYRPVIPAIYNPVLNELEKMQIKMVERFGIPYENRIK